MTTTFALHTPPVSGILSYTAKLTSIHIKLPSSLQQLTPIPLAHTHQVSKSRYGTCHPIYNWYLHTVPISTLSMKKHSHTAIQYGYDVNRIDDDSRHDDISEVRNLWPDETRDVSNRNSSDTSYVKSSSYLSKYHISGSSFFKLFIVSCVLCRWFFIGTETRIIANDNTTNTKHLLKVVARSHLMSRHPIPTCTVHTS